VIGWYFIDKKTGYPLFSFKQQKVQSKKQEDPSGIFSEEATGMSSSSVRSFTSNERRNAKIVPSVTPPPSPVQRRHNITQNHRTSHISVQAPEKRKKSIQEIDYRKTEETKRELEVIPHLEPDIIQKK
jgi:hypothetical protein